MARSAILGNGSLTVGLNKNGFVHDFYYPYVGQENLTTARSTRHKLGVWVDGVFSWTDDDPAWQHSVELSSDALTTTTTMSHPQLEITLISNDFVDHQDDIFCRRFMIHNTGSIQKDVRLFFHQVFQISQSGRADTAAYIPDGNYILNYKGSFNLLIGGRDQNGNGFDQFAVGSYGIEGKFGTYMDAEDGELSGNAVEHAGVDSVIRFASLIPAEGFYGVDYWIIADQSSYSGHKIQEQLARDGLNGRLANTELYWQNWLAVSDERTANLSPERKANVRKSIMTIKAHCDKRGGVIASCDSSIYNYGRDYYSYVWPRDSAYALWPLIRLGYQEEAKKFFEFCVDTITDEGYLMHKYQPDGTIGSSWHPRIQSHVSELPIQEDETAMVIILLNEYSQLFDDKEFVDKIYKLYVVKATNFLATFTDEQTGLPHPSYDLWEERFLTSTYTTAVTYRALLAANEIASELGTPQTELWDAQAKKFLSLASVFNMPDGSGGYRKGFTVGQDGLLFDDTTDASSIYSVLSYGFYTPDDVANLHQGMEQVQAKLKVAVSPFAFARHENDGYFKADPTQPGNPWIIVTLWMAQYYIRSGQIDKAQEFITWVEHEGFKGSMLPEQLDPNTGTPISVTPLVWSHAEYVSTILDLEQKQ